MIGVQRDAKASRRRCSVEHAFSARAGRFDTLPDDSVADVL